jgi:hypothetical protein
MHRWPRVIVPLLVVGIAACLLPAAASANTSHHHLGGGGGGADPNADCLLWGYITVDGTVLDASASPDSSADASPDDAADAADPSDAGNDADAGGVDAAAPPDGGSTPGADAVLVCLEHATLFGCDCAAARTHGPASAVAAAVVSVVLLGFAILRRRSARQRRSRP